MKYALLINERVGAYEQLSADQRATVTAEYVELVQDERVLGSEQLQPATTATTLRVQDGEVLLTDGPFAETKEIFGGYYILDAHDLDEALAFAARMPAARFGGSIEVRPVVER
ncbi:YciI family protein [Candidatus Solirubrobacter pratensis]|uniref:YciI family protein n=1 Tax=Candidatus Solirubrobacter pratensis TaxID=1298857 RepID=UPI00040269BA|nr:YciI family protein [Candidatus Solirubrobacter pratensis]